jgi:hypothetical protein
MSLTGWLAAGWLQPHKTSPAEIRDLWQIVALDLHDAAASQRDAEELIVFAGELRTEVLA